MSGYKGKRVLEEPSTPGFKSICILGGKNIGSDKEFLSLAKELGQTLANRGVKLIYGGGMQGLRGCAATTALITGGKVLSVSLRDSSFSYFPVGTELKVSNLPERLKHLFQNAEAFVVLPGSLGTLSEVFSIAYWSDLDFHKKPLILLNINGFYDGLITFLDHAMEQEIMSQAARRTILSASTVGQLINLLQAYTSNSNPSHERPDQQSPDNKRLMPNINLNC